MVVAGNWNGNQLVIKRVAQIPTPAETIADGHITQPDKLVLLLRQVLKENHISKGDVNFSVESTEIIQREITLPQVSDKELRSMVPFEVETNFPVKMDEYCLEYQKLEELTEDGIKKIRLMVAAMPREMVESYFNLAKGLGLKPSGLKLQAGSIARLFNKSKSINNIPLDFYSTLALIDLGQAKLGISFVSQGSLTFSRTIPSKSKNLNEMIISAFGISSEKAFELQKQSSLVKLRGEMLDPTSLKLRELLQDKADEWVMELQPIFRYYLGMNGSHKIDKIILYGGYSTIPGIDEYFQDVFNRPALTVNTLSVLDYSKKMQDVPLTYLLNAAGSLIQE